MTGDELLALAERALRFAGGEAQATVKHERSLFSRFARSAPTQSTGIDDVRVELAVVRDGHVGSATSNLLDDDSLRATAQQAASAAEALARDGPGEYPGVADDAVGRPHQGWDSVTAELDPAAAGAALTAAFAVAERHGLEAYGLWTAGEVHTAYATSTGLRVTDQTTDAFMKVLCRDRSGRSGLAQATGTRIAALNARGLAERAAAKVVPGDSVELAPGEYPVVLAPEAVGALLDFAGWLCFNGLAHVEKRSALTGRIGTRVVAPAINLSDSPRYPATLPRSYDAEGTPKAPLPLIQEGVAHRVAHDRRSAALAGDGASSTGHAYRAGGDPGGPWLTNLVLAGGDAASEQELMAPIERGIYVTRLWYVNIVHEKQALLTGMSRDGTFLIEDGKLGPRCHDVRFTDSVLRILDATEALTSAQRLVSEGEFYGGRFAFGVVCPALRAQGFRVTGATTDAA